MWSFGELYLVTAATLFLFTGRLGLRLSAMLISPWVAKDTVFQQPSHGPQPSSQFELSSVPATVKNLFNLTSFLTKRDAWAGNLEELLLPHPRTCAPTLN